MINTTFVRFFVVIPFILNFSAALRYEYGDGSYYVGGVNEGGRPSGKGKFFNSSRALEYEGDFVDGQPHGNGTWYGADGVRLEGQFQAVVKDRRSPPVSSVNGRAILRTKDGDKIEGDFVNSQPEGQIVLQRSIGERIEGHFRAGMPHGKIVWRNRAGSRLEGDYRQGRPHGHARLFDNHGKLVFEGEFYNGKATRPMPHRMNVEGFWVNRNATAYVRMHESRLGGDNP